VFYIIIIIIINIIYCVLIFFFQVYLHCCLKVVVSVFLKTWTH